MPWTHMCQLAGHPMEADIDCSVTETPARFAVVGDYDGDGFDEIFVAPTGVIQITGGGGPPPPPSPVGVGWVMKYIAATNKFEHLSPIAGNNTFDADVIFTGGDMVSAIAVDFDGPGPAGRKQPQILGSFPIVNTIRNWFGFPIGYSGSFLFQIMAFSKTAKTWNDVGNILMTVSDWPAFVMQHRPLFGVGKYLRNSRDQLVMKHVALGTLGNDFFTMQYTGPGPVKRGPGWLTGLFDFDCSSSNYAARFAVSGDFDGDGYDEIAVAPEAPGSMGNDFWVMKFDGTRWGHMGLTSTGFWADFDCSPDGGRAKFAVTGDFDGDGRDEIAVAREASGALGNEFWVMKWNAGTQKWDHLGAVTDGLSSDFGCSTQPTPAKFAVVGDFDGDGFEEIAVAPEAAGTSGNDFWVMKWNTNRAAWEHLGLTRTTNFWADFDCSSKVDFAARFAVAGDFDGDGRSEIAVAADALGSAGNDFWVMKFV